MIYDLRFTILWRAAVFALLSTLNAQLSSCFAFEGRCAATLTSGGQGTPLLYTVGTNFLRVEMTATNWPNPVDVLDRNSGELTLLYPHNRSFVRLKPAAENSTAPPGFPQMPGGLPPGGPAMPNPPLPAPQHIGPTNLPRMPGAAPMPPMPNLPPGVGPQAAPGQPAIPTIPAMSMMPPPMTETMALQDMRQKTNLLGFVCEHYEIKQRGETMEIWATDQLFPFQPYVQNQPHRFGPRMMEEQWAGLLAEKHLFPLLAVLKFDNGADQLRFEVQSVRPQKLTDADAKLFQPPANYFEIQPLPF